MDEGENLFMFYIIDKPWDATGGTLDVNLQATGEGIGSQSDPPVSVAVTLEDDVWNTYDWDPANGTGHFYWNWLQCCTDGMVMGILPDKIWSYTFFWNLQLTTNMDGGTQAIQWDPRNGTACRP